MSKLKTKNQNLDVKFNIKYRTYNFFLLIIKFVSKFPEKRIYWIISDQLLRSVTSIGPNIVEAKALVLRKNSLNIIKLP